jgi:hypothetical protein
MLRQVTEQEYWRAVWSVDRADRRTDTTTTKALTLSETRVYRVRRYQSRELVARMTVVRGTGHMPVARFEVAS